MTLSSERGLARARPWPPGILASVAGLRSALLADLVVAVVLGALVLTRYLPAIGFGLHWDDPRWYQQGVGLSVLELFTALPTYQFYRPLTILINRQLIGPNGSVNIPLAHVVLISAHLLACLLMIRVLPALGFERWHARLTALLFAVYPLAYQAVAWQAAQQPLVLLGVLLALWLANQAYRHRPLLWLGLSLAVYGAALLIQEGSVLFAFAFVWLAVVRQQPLPAQRLAQRRSLAWRWWPVLHLGLAALYVLIWLQVPRASGVTGTGFQPEVLGYLLQSAVFPLAYLLADSAAAWPLQSLVGVLALAAGLLALAVWYWTSRRAAVLAVAWMVAGMLPIWAGLSWDYVQVGSRLIYPAALGIAALWAGVAVWVFAQSRWRQAVGWLTLAGVLALSQWQGLQFARLYQVGIGHLDQTVRLLSAQPEARLLFVNFPDRLEFRPRLYPLGYWGLTLAPVVQQLSDFALTTTGQSGSDQSVSVFQVGAAEREAWPYRVDMRGSDTPPEALVTAAVWADAVYLTEYQAGGQLGLRPVGAVHPLVATVAPLAMIDSVVDLLEAEVLPGPHPELRLVWHSRAALPPDATIFVHFWQEGVFVAAADGASLGGLLPPAAWQPGLAVHDWRRLDVDGLAPGHYELRVGLYRWWDGQRLWAYSPQGERLRGDAVPVGHLELP